MDRDDITAIQALYGEKRAKPSVSPVTTERPRQGRPVTLRTTTTTASYDDTELCNDASIDSIVTLQDDVTYAFKGDSYWKLTDDSIAPGYPKSISRDWDGVP